MAQPPAHAAACLDQLERVTVATDATAAIHERLGALRRRFDLPDAAREELDDCEFELKLHSSRAIAACKAARVAAAAADERSTLIESESERRAAQIAELQRRVAEHETRQARGPILGAQWLAQHAGPLLAQGGPCSSGSAPSDPHTPRGAPCSCGATHDSGTACEHREMLASNIIDNTFDDHRRMLRKRLMAAEDELKRLKNGDTFRDMQRTILDLQAQLRAKDADMAAAETKWLGMLSSASALAARAAPAPQPVKDSSSRSAATAAGSVADAVGCSTLMLHHALLLGAFQAAAYDVKLAVLADTFVLPSQPPPPRVKVPSPPGTPSALPVATMRARPAPNHGDVLADPVAVDHGSSRQLPRSRVLRHDAPEPPRAPMAATAAADGASSVSRKPLHPPQARAQQPAGTAVGGAAFRGSR